MAIAALLEASPAPSPEAIDALPNICRCGAYPRIRKAIARAARASAAAVPRGRPSGRGPPDAAASSTTDRLSNGSSAEAQFPDQTRS